MTRLLASSMALAMVAAAAALSAPTPTQRSTFDAENPSFLWLGETARQASPSLLITQFTGNPFAHDSVSVVTDVGSVVAGGAAPKELTENVTWPNEGRPVPAGAFSPAFDGWTLAEGFLVPGKSNGCVSLLGTDGGVIELSAPKAGWFYHRVLWVDMNGDGKLDLLTARATKPLFGSAAGELLWLEQPATDPLSGPSLPWAEHSLVTGAFAPDVFFVTVDLDGDGSFEVLYTSFFTGGGLGFVSATNWADPTTVTNTVVDKSPGPMFDVKVADVNGDGNMDVLATNNGAQAGKQGLFAYELPSDLKSNWTRHTLASGFMPQGWGPGKGAPGSFTPFHPTVNDTSGKPLVALSGDDDQNAYIISANSTDPTNWDYTTTVVRAARGAAMAARKLGDRGVVGRRGDPGVTLVWRLLHELLGRCCVTHCAHSVYFDHRAAPLVRLHCG